MASYNFLTPYIRARYSVLYMQTSEETRAETQILEAAKECSDSAKMQLLVWSFTQGLQLLTDKGPKPVGDDTSDPINALKAIQVYGQNAIFVLRDMHPFLDNPMVRRLIRDISRDFKVGVVGDKPCRRTVIMVSPVNQIPEDLRTDVSLIELTLPDVKALTEIVDNMLVSPDLKQRAGGNEGREKIIEACKGLTTSEAQDAIGKSLVIRKLDPESPSVASLVMTEKAQALKKTGILEYYHSSLGMDSIGGLDVLKGWLDIRQQAFTKEAREFGLPVPRGALLAGVPGCGKSLAAKAAAAKYNVPLVKFDMGRIFGGLVGQSEANMRTAIQTAEAIGHCVLWIDEIDKAFAGMQGGGNTDGGVALRVFGNFITWMQEKTVPCFILATANRIEGLPPELLRKGRFDEIFFVDLPSPAERKEILEIHVKRRRPKLKLDLTEAVEASDQFSGAELEEVVTSALYQAFYDKNDLTADAIVDAVNKTVPLAKSRKADIDKMRTWAETNAVSASTNKKATVKVGARNVG